MMDDRDALSFLPSGIQGSFSESDIVRQIRTIAQSPQEAAKAGDTLVRLLKETASQRVRNAAAIALLDLGPDEERVLALRTVLGRPDLASSSGTLLFVLNEMGAKLPLGLVAPLIANGSYEAREEVLTFIDKEQLDEPDEDTLLETRHSLEQLASMSDEPLAAAALRALDALKGERSPSLPFL